MEDRPYFDQESTRTRLPYGEWRRQTRKTLIQATKQLNSYPSDSTARQDFLESLACYLLENNIPLNAVEIALAYERRNRGELSPHQKVVEQLRKDFPQLRFDFIAENSFTITGPGMSIEEIDVIRPKMVARYQELRGI